MTVYRSATESDEAGIPDSVTQAKLSRLTVDFITSIRATVVSLGMYPPGSQTIANAVEKVSHNLQNVLELQPIITFSEINGMLLIDGQQLDERDRKKAPVMDFIASIMERKIQSITFEQAATSEELIDFLLILSKKAAELKDISLVELLEDKGVKNIQLNERIYVATTAEEQEKMGKWEEFLKEHLIAEVGMGGTGGGEGGGAGGAGGGISIGNLDRETLAEMLGNKQQTKMVLENLFETTIDEEEEAGIAGQVAKLHGMLLRSSNMFEAISDQEQRENFVNGLADAMVKVDPPVAGQLLIEEQREPTKVSDMGIEPVFFEKVSEESAVEITEHTIGQVTELRDDLPNLPPEEREASVLAMKKSVKMLLVNLMGRGFYNIITEKLVSAGLVREEAIQQLIDKVKREKETEGGSEHQEVEAINLTNSDGSINEDELLKIIDNFENLTDGQIMSVVAGIMEILGEVIFHDKLDVLVDKMVERLDSDGEFTPLYAACADFLEKTCMEVIFNERYGVADSILTMFRKHAGVDVGTQPGIHNRSNQALETIASDDVRRMLLTIYQHGEDEAREQVGAVISKMGHRMTSALLELLKTSDDLKTRRKIMNLLKQSGKDVLKSVEIELNDPGNEWFILRNMISLLGEIGGAEQAEWLRPFSSHDNPRVKTEAIKSMAKLDPENSLDMVRFMLEDSDLSVRRFAITTLGTLKDTESIPNLLKLIAKKNVTQIEEEDGIQADAVTALGKMGGPEIEAALLDALKKEGILSKNRTKTPEVRARVCFSLGSFPPSPGILKAVKAAAKDSNPTVSEAAKMILPRLGG